MHERKYELNWFVNTESQNFYFAFLLCILLLQKCLLSSVEKPSILDKKERLVLLMPFFPAVPMDCLEDRRRAEFYHRGRGKGKPASLRYPSSTPRIPRESRKAVCCQLLGSPPLASSPPVPSPSGSVRWDFRERCPWRGVRRRG